jgi:hypothetical protein
MALVGAHVRSEDAYSTALLVPCLGSRTSDKCGRCTS